MAANGRWRPERAIRISLWRRHTADFAKVIDKLLAFGPRFVLVRFDLNRVTRNSDNVIIEFCKKPVTVRDVVHEFSQPRANPAIRFNAKLRAFDFIKTCLKLQHSLVATEIVLTTNEREELEMLIRSGLTSVRLALRARIALLAAERSSHAKVCARSSLRREDE